MSARLRRATHTERSDVGARSIRIGVDVGGTFTDFVLHDPRRDRVHTGKLLTTPDDPSEAIVNGVLRLLRESDLKPADVHSIVTGATVGLITTEGFRDVIEIGKEVRYDLYDLFLEAPPTLVPRRRRLEVTERLDVDGNVLVALDEAAAAASARSLI